MTRDHPTVKIMVAYLVLIATLLYFDASHQVMAFDDIDRLDTVVSSSIVDNHRNTTEENRISNGHLAGGDETSVVSIASYYDDSTEGRICAGALISTKSVVTAAHCVMDIGDVKPNIIVSVGTAANIDTQLSDHYIQVAHRYINDNFSNSNSHVLDYDIAVLELKTSTERTGANPVDFNDPFPQKIYYDAKMYGWGKYSKQEEEYMGGAGYADLLRKLSVSLSNVSNEECQAKYKKNNIDIKLTDRLFCGVVHKDPESHSRVFNKNNTDVFPIACGDNGAPVITAAKVVAMNVYSMCRNVDEPVPGVYIRTGHKDIKDFLLKHVE